MDHRHKLINQLRLLVLNAGYAEHDADWNWKDVTSPFMRIYYVTEGTAKVLFPNKVQELTAGHLYIIPPFTCHSYACKGIFKHYYLHICEDRDATDDSILEEWDFPTEVEADGIDLELISRLCQKNPTMTLPQSNPKVYDNNTMLIRNIVKNQSRNIADIVESRGIVLFLFSRFLKEVTPKKEVSDNRIQKCISHIRRHIDQKFDIDALAQFCCLSKDHFIHLFKKETGIPPLRYINQKKIERAQLLLITQDYTIKQISYMLSFDDHSYFIRLFRNTVGMSPMEYRRSHSEQFV